MADRVAARSIVKGVGCPARGEQSSHVGVVNVHGRSRRRGYCL